MGILITYLLGLLTGVQSTRPAKRPAQTVSNPGADGPLLVVLVPTPLTDEERETKRKKQGRKAISFWVNIATLAVLSLYTLFTILIWSGNNKSAEYSHRQLEMIDRPWIKDNVQSASEFLFQNGGISWAVTLNAANVGKSVATEIYPDAKLIAIRGADFLDGPRQQVSELCNSLSLKFQDVKKTYPSIWNSSIFPGDTLPLPRGVILWAKDINADVSFDGGAQLGKSVNPMLIGCIVYHYGNSDTAHHTGFVYVLSHNEEPSTPESARVFFSIGKTLPKDSIVLRKFGEFAD